MKILVTGGAGFIGSHVVDKYIELGHEVIVVDNFFSGFEHNLNPKARFINLDIRNEHLRDIIWEEKPEVINHLAAQSSVKVSVEVPSVDEEINIFGTLNMLLAMKHQPEHVKKFIYSNTGGALFGEPDSLPVKEDSPIHPESPYGVSKYSAERYIHAFSKLVGFKYTSLRYSNVYGPRQNPHGEAGVVAIFAGAIKEGRQPKIFGDGNKTRDYVFIEDVVESNVLALDKGDNDVFLIGSGEEVKDIDVFNAVKEAMRSDIQPEFAEHRKGDIMHMRFDPSKAEKILGWKSKTDFKAGVAKTVATL